MVWENFSTASGEQTLTVDSAAFKDWVKQFEVSPSADLLSSPVVTTVSGRQARLSVTETKTPPPALSNLVLKST